MNARWIRRWRPISSTRPWLAGVVPEQQIESAGNAVRQPKERKKRAAAGLRASPPALHLAHIHAEAHRHALPREARGLLETVEALGEVLRQVGLARLELRSQALRRTAVRSAALEPRQTCYGFEADLQAVAPFQEQWHENSTLIRGKSRLRQRQELAGHGFHRRSSVGRP